jgi:hypothetical protein
MATSTPREVEIKVAYSAFNCDKEEIKEVVEVRVLEELLAIRGSKAPSSRMPTRPPRRTPAICSAASSTAWCYRTDRRR